MEEIKILEKLYEEGRKKIPELERKLLWKDIDNEVVNRDGQGMKIYFQGYSPVESFTRLGEISPKYLKSKGFTSAKPTLSEFLGKNGIDNEIAIFFGLYTAAIKLVAEYHETSSVKDAREQGIRDAEMSARARNRNRNYKEDWEGDE